MVLLWLELVIRHVSCWLMNRSSTAPRNIGMDCLVGVLVGTTMLWLQKSHRQIFMSHGEKHAYYATGDRFSQASASFTPSYQQEARLCYYLYASQEHDVIVTNRWYRFNINQEVSAPEPYPLNQALMEGD